MERHTLLELRSVGKGGAPAYLRVDTVGIRLKSTTGTSIWKAALGTLTLGASVLATGISTNNDDDIEVPLAMIQFARTKSTGPAYSTIHVAVGGQLLPFSLASIHAQLAVQAINAAVAGGEEAAAFVDAFRISHAGATGRQPSTRERRKLLKQGVITREAFDYGEKVSVLARQMR